MTGKERKGYTQMATRNSKRSNRTKEQAQERQAEQVRRYSRASGRALHRLKANHQDEYWAIFDEELPKEYTTPLPWEDEECQPQQTATTA